MSEVELCPHDLSDHDIAWGDGMCAVCLLADLRAAKAQVEQLSKLAARYEADAARLDWLEQAVWSDAVCSNGIAIFPTVGHVTRERHVALQDLGEEDGSNLGSEITGSHSTIRAAIDAARTQTGGPTPPTGKPKAP